MWNKGEVRSKIEELMQNKEGILYKKRKIILKNDVV